MKLTLKQEKEKESYVHVMVLLYEIVCTCHRALWDYKVNEAKSAPLNGVKYKQSIESNFEFIYNHSSIVTYRCN